MGCLYCVREEDGPSQLPLIYRVVCVMLLTRQPLPSTIPYMQSFVVLFTILCVANKCATRGFLS